MARKKRRNNYRSQNRNNNQNRPAQNSSQPAEQEQEVLVEETVETPEAEEINLSDDLDDEEGDALIESALDKLRKEKETTEDTLLEILEVDDQEDMFGEDIELTTANLFASEPAQDLLEKTQELDAISKYEGQEPLRQNLLMQEAEVQEDEGSSLKTRQLWASILVAVITVLIGAIILLYIYNQQMIQNVTTPVIDDTTQTPAEVGEQVISKQLEEFADEYENMTQEERLKLLDLNMEYEALTLEEQEKINEYFLDKTGESYRELHASLTLLKNNLDNESASQNS